MTESPRIIAADDPEWCAGCAQKHSKCACIVLSPCRECHPELHRSQCTRGGCVARPEQTATDGCARAKDHPLMESCPCGYRVQIPRGEALRRLDALIDFEKAGDRWDSVTVLMQVRSWLGGVE